MFNTNAATAARFLNFLIFASVAADTLPVMEQSDGISTWSIKETLFCGDDEELLPSSQEDQDSLDQSFTSSREEVMVGRLPPIERPLLLGPQLDLFACLSKPALRGLLLVLAPHELACERAESGR